MKKILISKWVPSECLSSYTGKYDFTMPSKEKIAFTYDEVYEMVDQYDAYLIINNKGDRKIIDKAVNLKVLGNFGVGYNSIDVDYATEKGLPVVNTPRAVTEVTSEHTIALIISSMRGIARYDREIRKGIWHAPLFSDSDSEIYGKTLGIVGFGRIGKMVCKKAKGLGMKVIYYDSFRASEAAENEYGAAYKPFDEVVKESDCITVHVPYVPENHHLFNKETFGKMKKSAYFINASRGLVVDEKALAEALKNGVIKGAGLDVFEEEPKVNKELLTLENVTLTPHIASCTFNARVGMCAEALMGIDEILEGKKPYNVVNPEALK